MVQIFSTAIFIAIYFMTLDKRRFFQDPFTWMFYGYFMFVFFIPLNMVYNGDYVVAFQNGLSQITVAQSALDAMSWIGVVGFIGVVTGYGVSKRWMWALIDERGFQPPHELKLNRQALKISAIAIWGILFTTQFDSILASLKGYESNFSESATNVTYGFLKYFCIFSQSFYWQYEMLHTKKPINNLIKQVLFFSMCSVLLFSKTYFMFAIFAIISYLYRIRFKWIYTSIIMSLIAGYFVMYILMPLYSIYRGTGTFEWKQAMEASNQMVYSDPIGPFAIFVYVYDNASVVNIPNFLFSFVLWIPRFIWRERPLDPAESMAQSLLPDWRPGMGMAYSPVVEGFTRGGTIGAFLVMFMIGITFVAMISIACRFYPRGLRLPLLMSMGSFIMFMINRGSYSAMITMFLQFLIPHFAIFVTTRGIINRSGSLDAKKPIDSRSLPLSSAASSPPPRKIK